MNDEQYPDKRQSNLALESYAAENTIHASYQEVFKENGNEN